MKKRINNELDLSTILTSLKSGKIRIIEINHSEKNYDFVNRCFKDITDVPDFHYNNKNINKNNHCYFGFFIKKVPFYLFIDKGRHKIVIYNFKTKSKPLYIPESEHNEIKQILEKSKSVSYYLNRNNYIKKTNNVICAVLIAIYTCLLCANFTPSFDEVRFGIIALNATAIIAIQDCMNVLLLRFERKHYDRKLIFLGLLEFLSLIIALFALFIPGPYDKAFSQIFNALSIFITIGALLLRFDKVRDDE